MKTILRVLSYPLTAIFYLCFGICIVLFHPVQWFCFNVFGYAAHKRSVEWLNWWLMRCLNILGSRFTVTLPEGIPKDVPIIIVSNHQSMWDIPPIIWYMRKLHPKFVSKMELGKGIPSISYNLRHGGNILIDRKNPKQALTEMIKFGRYLSEKNFSGVIFAEGTRSRDGHPKPFRRSGVSTLFKKTKDAYVLPLTVNNSWKLQRYGMFPVPLGVHVKLIAHAPLKISDYDLDELIDTVEKTVTSAIEI